MVKKFKLQTIITALLCSVMLLGCSNLIEDLKNKGEPVVPVSSITLNATATVTVEEGSKITLTATVLPADATDKTVIWTSSDETVATVVNGVITGLKAGTVTITATAGGKSVSCTVTVKEPAVKYNIDWNTTKITGLDKTAWEFAMEAGKIVFGFNKDYESVIADTAYTKYAVGETPEDLIFAYYKPSTDDETNDSELYVLSEGEIKFEEDDMIDAGGQKFAMFAGCTAAESIVLKNVNTSELTSLIGCFYYCLALKTIDLSGVDTENVTDMSNMFNFDLSLQALDLSMFNTSKLTTMREMFYYSGVSSINLGNIDTSNVTDMNSLFSYCTNLESLDLSKFNTSKVTDMKGMFFNCTSLTSLDVTNFNTNSVTDMAGMFASCSSLTSLDVSSFNTSSVTAMNNMFNECSALTSLDVTKFNTSSVTDMAGMFQKCSSLTKLDVTKFDTSSATDMFSMFYGCSALTTLDVTKFDTSSVTDMSNMFNECSALKTLDVTKFNTSSVTNMKAMFNGCGALTTLDVTKFDTSSVTHMDSMFKGCSVLTTLDVTNFNTSSVEHMTGMFGNCYSLAALDVTHFNTSKVFYMSNIFENCYGLEELDLSSFTFDKMGHTDKMFSFDNTSGKVSKLKTIYVKPDTDISALATNYNSEDMFKGCTALVGGKGTVYDSAKTDKSYARIDGGSSNPGYFTKKGDAPYVIPTGTADFSFTLTSGSEINVTKAENVLTADEGYTDYTWYVDTVKKTRATTNTFDLDVAGLTKSGTYNITLEAKKNGEVYSSSMFVKYVAVLPEHFVKVTGGLITGSDDNMCWTSDYRGAFVADRKVKLSNFIICDHEVTKADYKAIMNDSTLNTAGITADPSYTTNQPAKYVIADGEDDEKRPVENVSWYDAVYYCNLLSQIKGLDCVYEITDITTSESTISNAGTSGKETVTVKYISSATVTADHTKNGYRLLTEAEWEYAARGGNPSVAAWKYEYAGAYSTKTSVPYTTDDFLGSVGWYNYNSNNTGTTTSSPASEGTKGHSSHQVELKSGNALGIYDMSGNVWEWCYDGYDSSVTSNDSAYTQYGKVVDPVGAASVSNRVIRGGCWANDARSTSVGHRGSKNQGSPGNGVGFRICRTDN